MVNKIDKYISELLFLHDCVILPDFGGFVANEKSAELNNLTGALTPPSKEILFNINLKTNDGLLITHVANNENISHELAKKKISDYVDSLSKKLHTKKLLRIEKVGLFTQGYEGNITFIQDKTINYSLLSYGLSTTFNKKITRDTINKNQLKSKIIPIKNYSIKPKNLLKAAAIIIPLITLSYLSISQQNNINNVYNQMASLNLFTFNKNIDKVISHDIENNITSSISSELFNRKIKQELDIEVQNIDLKSKKTYHIIGGVFSEEKNAQRLLAKLNRWHYSAKIIRKDKLMRVSYESFDNKEDAKMALYKIKEENPNAWLLTN